MIEKNSKTTTPTFFFLIFANTFLRFRVFKKGRHARVKLRRRKPETKLDHGRRDRSRQASTKKAGHVQQGEGMCGLLKNREQKLIFEV